MMLETLRDSIDHHQARLIPLFTRILGNELRRKMVVEISEFQGDILS